MPNSLRSLVGRARRTVLARRECSLSLRFSSAQDFVDFLADPQATRRVSRLAVRVEPWTPIRPDWAGRLGPLPELLTLRTRFDPTRGKAAASLSVASPVPAIDLVRAAYSLFFPVRPTTGWGGDRVAVRPDAPADTRWHPGGGVRPLFPKKDPKGRFAHFDVVIDGAGEHRITDPQGDWTIVDRPQAPVVLIDPKVHRPIERRQPSPETQSATATLAGDRLHLSAGSRLLLDAPVAAPLTAVALRGLALVTDVNVSGLGSGPAASQRVAELAAYGAVVHQASADLALAPALKDLVSAPFTSRPLLDHMNRSLAQVRAVMRHHTRAFTTGELPTVSVILPTIRPELVGRVLEQFAAQDYPHVEVVVGCHGFPAPERTAFPEHVQSIIGPILEFPRSVIFGDVLAALSGASSGAFIAKVDDDDWYGPSHLTDLVTAWTYSEAQLVGKKVALIHLEESDTLIVRRFFLEGYRWAVAGGASLIDRHDLAAIGGWRAQVRAVDRGLESRLTDAGGVQYSCTGPGYVHVRHAEPHTWAVSEDYFKGSFVETTLQGIPPAALGLLDPRPQ